MVMPQVRSIQMYSLVRWPVELRKKFYLPYDPYYIGDDAQKREAAEASITHLKRLGVFFYRDDDHSAGIIMKPTVAETPDYIKDDTPFKCDDPLDVFQFFGEMTYPVLEPVQWEKPKDRSKQFRYNQLLERYGDINKWYRFNTEKMLRQVERGMVTSFQ
jgi:hypothetical protein